VPTGRLVGEEKGDVKVEKSKRTLFLE